MTEIRFDFLNLNSILLLLCIFLVGGYLYYEIIKINRKSLVMQRNNLFWQCQFMNGSQVIRKRDSYFKEILKNNKI